MATDTSLGLILQAAGLGVAAGMRSMTAPAVTSNYLASGRASELSGTPFEPIARPEVADWLAVAAAGEIVGDKLPFAPARTQLPSVIFRSASGALCGAILMASRKQGWAAGAAAGFIGGLLGTYGFYYLRKGLTEHTPLPDFVVAVGEDLLAAKTSLICISE